MPEKPRIDGFTQLDVWQRAKELHAAICAATKQETFRREFKLVGQIKDSASSVMANIAEGFKRKTKADKARIMNVAEGSLEEARYYLRLSHDLGYIAQTDLPARAQEVGRLLGAYVRALAPPSSRS